MLQVEVTAVTGRSKGAAAPLHSRMQIGIEKTASIIARKPVGRRNCAAARYLRIILPQSYPLCDRAWHTDEHFVAKRSLSRGGCLCRPNASGQVRRRPPSMPVQQSRREVTDSAPVRGRVAARRRKRSQYQSRASQRSGLSGALSEIRDTLVPLPRGRGSVGRRAGHRSRSSRT